MKRDLSKYVESFSDKTNSGKDAPTNPRGIPYAPFVDKVEDYVSTRDEVEGALKRFQEMISYVPPKPRPNPPNPLLGDAVAAMRICMQLFY